jgi:hypothetical protein
VDVLQNGVDTDQTASNRVHVIPAAYRIIYWSAAGLCAAGVIGCGVVPYFASGSFDAIYFAFFGSLLLGCLTAAGAIHAFRLGDEFRTDELGISCFRPDGTVVHLRWDEIAVVRVRSILERVELADEQRTRKMKLEFQLTDFEELAESIMARTGKSEQARSAVPARHWIGLATALLLPLVSIRFFGGVLILAWLISLKLV